MRLNIHLSILLILTSTPAVAQVVSTTSPLADAEAAQRLAAAHEEIAALKAERSQLLVRVVALTDELSASHIQQERLEDQLRQFAAKLARAERVLRDAPDDVAKPFVGDGVVTAVAKQFCEISIGSDDGVKVGRELNVFRGKSYLGRIVIRQTNPDKSVGEIIPVGPKGAIEKGDKVRSIERPPMPQVDDNGIEMSDKDKSND